MKQVIQRCLMVFGLMASYAYANTVGLSYHGNAMYDLQISHVQSLSGEPPGTYLVQFSLLNQAKQKTNNQQVYRIYCPNKTVRNMQDVVDRPHRSAAVEDSITWSGEYVIRFVVKNVCRN